MALGVWDYYIIKFPPCNLPRVYQEVLMPVVRIRAGTSTGSGVIISDKHILTAAHVVGNNNKVQVIYYSYHQDTKAPSCLASCLSAFVVMTDTNKDLALLRYISSQKYKQVRLAPKDYQPYLFTEVYAVGCSLGLNPRPSEGMLTSIGINRWEISASALPGNSGGGVFLKDTHELIGITVWVRTHHDQLITTMTGIVPIQQIYKFLEQIPGVNSEEDKRQGLTVGPAGVLSAQSEQGGPTGQPYLMKGGEKSWHKQ